MVRLWAKLALFEARRWLAIAIDIIDYEYLCYSMQPLRIRSGGGVRRAADYSHMTSPWQHIMSMRIT